MAAPSIDHRLRKAVLEHDWDLVGRLLTDPPPMSGEVTRISGMEIDLSKKIFSNIDQYGRTPWETVCSDDIVIFKRARAFVLKELEAKTMHFDCPWKVVELLETVPTYNFQLSNVSTALPREL